MTIAIHDSEARLTIETLDNETYRQFLNVKRLPRYDVTPGTNGDWCITFPAIYADRFGIDYSAQELDLPLPLPDVMFDYQKVITRVSWRKKRYACFADAGLGKTLIFLELARQLAHLGKKTLIISPLMIINQTIEESMKFYGDGFHIVNLYTRQHYGGIGPNNIRAFAKDSKFKVGIINYDKFRQPIDLSGIDCVVLDESGILKSGTGIIRTNLIECTSGVEYKYCYSATPAPNSRIEYAQHAVFLEQIRAANEMYAMFFVNKENKWVLRRHGSDAFYRFLSGWSIFIRHPSAYGFNDNLKDLPPWKEIKIPVEMTQEQLSLIATITTRQQPTLPGLAKKPNGMKERGQYSQISKGFLYHRQADITHVASNKPTTIRNILADHPGEYAIIWCVYDEEGETIAQELREHTNLKIAHLTGKTPQEKRLQQLEDFRHGHLEVMISKPRLLGFGLNFQHVTIEIFSGLRDSFEEYYQAIKRAHRYGQTETLKVFLPYTSYEEVMLTNVLRKQERAEYDFAIQERLYINSLFDELQEYLEADRRPSQKETVIMQEPAITEHYELYHVDSISSMLDGLAENSVDFAIFSPPFRNDIYAYTNELGDMGNSGGVGEEGKYEFMLHFSFFLAGLRRAMKPGRLVACHVMQAPLRKGLDGVVGISDFRGDVIRAFCEQGFFQFGEVVILKNPQAQSIRLHINSLQFSTLERDRAQIVPSFPDYLLLFKKPGDNPAPIDNSEITRNEWIEFADAVWQEETYNHPGSNPALTIPQEARFDEYMATLAGVWHDIKETDTLNSPYARGRTKEFENADKHVCPLQLSLISRALKLWSLPQDTILSPFAGIGSEGVETIKLERYFIGMELKREYFLDAVRNLDQAVLEHKALRLL